MQRHGKIELDAKKSNQLEKVFFDKLPTLSEHEKTFLNGLTEERFSEFLSKLIQGKPLSGSPHETSINHKFNAIAAKKFKKIMADLAIDETHDTALGDLATEMLRYKEFNCISVYITDELIKKWILSSLEAIKDLRADRLASSVDKLFDFCRFDKRFYKLLYTDQDIIKKALEVNLVRFDRIYEDYAFKKAITPGQKEEKAHAQRLESKDQMVRANNKLNIFNLFDAEKKFSKLASQLVNQDIPDDFCQFYDLSQFQSDNIKNAIIALLKMNFSYSAIKNKLIDYIFYDVQNELSSIDLFAKAKVEFNKSVVNNAIRSYSIGKQKQLALKVEALITQIQTDPKSLNFLDRAAFTQNFAQYLMFSLPKPDNKDDYNNLIKKLCDGLLILIVDNDKQKLAGLIDKILMGRLFIDRIGDPQLLLDEFEKSFNTKFADSDRQPIIDRFEYVKERMEHLRDLTRQNKLHPYLAKPDDDKSQFQMQQQQQQQLQVKSLAREDKIKLATVQPNLVTEGEKQSEHWLKWFGSRSQLNVTVAAFDKLKAFMNQSGLGLQVSHLPAGFYIGIYNGQEFIDYDEKNKDILQKSPLTLSLVKSNLDFKFADYFTGPAKDETPAELNTILQQMLQADDNDVQLDLTLLLPSAADEQTNALKSLIYLCHTHGALGVNLLLDQLTKLQGKCDLAVFKKLFIYPFADWGSQTMHSGFVNAVNGIASLNKQELTWWNTLLKQHLAGAGVAELPDLYQAFSYFCSAYKNITHSDHLPDKCPIVDMRNMPIGLDRLLSILLHEKDPAQLDLGKIKWGIDDYADVEQKFIPIARPAEKKSIEPLVELPKKLLKVKRISDTKEDLEKQFDQTKVLEVISSINVLQNAVPALMHDKQKLELYNAFLLVNKLGKDGDATLFPKPVYRLSNDELKHEISQVKEKIKTLLADRQANIEAIKEAQLIYLALAREALYRADEHHRFANSTQIISVINEIILNPGDSFAQIETGQGKSLTTALMASMLMLQSEAVEVCTSDAHLAKSALNEFSEFYKLMAIPIATDVIAADSDEAIYQKHGINYSDVSSLAIYHDRMKLHHGKEFFTGKISGILDEADYIVDLQTTMRLTTRSVSTDDKKSARALPLLANNVLKWGLYPILNEFIDSREFNEVPAMVVDKRKYVIDLAMLYLKNHADPKYTAEIDEFYHDLVKAEAAFDKWLQAAVRAKSAFATEASGGIMVESVDLGEGHFTSKAFHVINHVKQEQAQLKEGGQQFLHARLQKKYQLEIDNDLRPAFMMEPETATLTSTISKLLVKFYQESGGRLKGTTGTLGDEDDRTELAEKFGVELTGYPTHQLRQRIDRTMLLANQDAVDAKLVQEIIHRLRKSDEPQPMLIVSEDPAAAKRLYELVLKKIAEKPALAAKAKLRLATVPFKKLNGKDEAPDENTVISDAALAQFITFTDESLARGKDFKPTHAEGMCVIQTYLGNAKGTEQVRGRAGRQGNVGESLHLVNENALLKDAALPIDKRITSARKTRSSRQRRKFDEFYAEIDHYFTDQFLDRYNKADNKPALVEQYVAFRTVLENKWQSLLLKRLPQGSSEQTAERALAGAQRELIAAIYPEWTSAGLSEIPKTEYDESINNLFPALGASQPAKKIVMTPIEDKSTDELPKLDDMAVKARWFEAANKKWQEKFSNMATELRTDYYPALDQYLVQLRELYLNTKTYVDQKGGEKRRIVDEKTNYLTSPVDYFAFAIDSARSALTIVEDARITAADKSRIQGLMMRNLKILQQRLGHLDESQLPVARQLFKEYHLKLASMIVNEKINAALPDTLKSMHVISERLIFPLLPEKTLGLYFSEPVKAPRTINDKMLPLLCYEKPLFCIIHYGEYKNDFDSMMNRFLKQHDVLSKIKVNHLRELVALSKSNEKLIKWMQNVLEKITPLLSDQAQIHMIQKLLDQLRGLNPKNTNDIVKTIDTAYCSIVDILEKSPLSIQQQYLGLLFHEHNVAVTSYQYPLATISSASQRDDAVLHDSKSAVPPPMLEKTKSVWNILPSLFQKKAEHRQSMRASSPDLHSTSSIGRSLKKKSITATLHDSIPDFLQNEALKLAVEHINPDYVYTIKAENPAKEAVYVDKWVKDSEGVNEYEIHTLQLPKNGTKEACWSLAYLQIQQFIAEMNRLKRDDFTLYIREGTTPEMVVAYLLVASANGLSVVDETGSQLTLDQADLLSVANQYSNLNKSATFKERCLWQKQVLDDLTHIDELELKPGEQRETLSKIEKRLAQRLDQYQTFFKSRESVDKYSRFQNTKESLEQAMEKVKSLAK